MFDEKWNVVADYPEDALKTPHGGIGDVQLGSLDGDGKLKMFVSYWGVVGVQGVSLDGKRLWDNRSLSNVVSIAVGGADDKGHRKLYCANVLGSLVVLDAQGQRQGEIKIPERILNWIVAADLRGDGQPLWCAMAAPKLGDNLAIGLALDGKELWSYSLPQAGSRSPSSRSFPANSPALERANGFCPGPMVRSTLFRPTANRGTSSIRA